MGTMRGGPVWICFSLENSMLSPEDLRRTYRLEAAQGWRPCPVILGWQLYPVHGDLEREALLIVFL